MSKKNHYKPREDPPTPYNIVSDTRTIRVGGKLRRLETLTDHKGDIIHKTITPLMFEFHPKDALQVIVGATLLAVPVAYTEEAWGLGQSLPLINVLGIYLVSIFFIALFVYYNYYKNEEGYNIKDFYIRTFYTYILSFIVVAFLITLIGISTWEEDLLLTIKRVVIITFPASMSAAVADVLK